MPWKKEELLSFQSPCSLHENKHSLLYLSQCFYSRPRCSKNLAVYPAPENTADLSVISTYLACFNETTVAASCAPWNFYFLISSCVIAALAVPPLGDIIIVITTSSSSCRQIILPGSSFFFSFFSGALQRRGNYIFHQASPLCVLWQRSYSIMQSLSQLWVFHNRSNGE